MSLFGTLRRTVVKIAPGAAEAFGAVYARGVAPWLPERLCAPRKYIGSYGPFRFHPRFLWRDFSAWGGSHNSGFAACVEAARGKRCLFDIGAHLGLVTMPMARMAGPEARLFAFEPATVNRRYLEKHLQLNGLANVTVLDALVGAEDRDGVEFFEQGQDSGLNSIVVRKDADRFQATRRRQVTLDTFCRERQLRPDLVKIDVEGAEFDVLAGMAEVLRTARPTIFLSLHPKHLVLLNRRAEELPELLRPHDYTCRNVDGSAITEFTLQEYLLVPENEAPR